MNDDAELLHRYVHDRSELAFTEFVQRHLALVYSAALRRTNGDQHQAAEVAQQVFTTAARRAVALARHDSLTGWLYTATRNAALNLQRTEQRRRIRESAALAMNEVAAAAAPEADWDQLRPVLDETMDELNDMDREAVLLRFFEGRAFAEVGARLHLSENVARMRTGRALDKLRAKLARRGITSTGAALALALANQATLAAPAGLAATVTSAALTAGAGLSATATILTFMSTNKLTLGLAGALLVAIATTTMLQQRANAELQREIAGLRQQNQALESARALNATLAQSAQDAAELARLRDRAAELKANLTTLASAEEAEAGPRMIRKNSWQNRGRATPTDAVETMLYASFNGDWDTLAKSFTFTPDAKARMDAFFAKLPADVRAKYSSSERLLAPLLWRLEPLAAWHIAARNQKWNDRMAYRPIGQQPIGSDGVEVQLLVNFPTGPEGYQKLPLRHTADGWVSGPWDDSTAEYLLARIDPATGEVRSGKQQTQPTVTPSGVRP